MFDGRGPGNGQNGSGREIHYNTNRVDEARNRAFDASENAVLAGTALGVIGSLIEGKPLNALATAVIGGFALNELNELRKANAQDNK